MSMIAHNKAEKELFINDLIVAHRRKKKGMAWSKVGSNERPKLGLMRFNAQLPHL